MSDIQLAGLVVSVLAAVGGLVVTLLRLQAGIAEQFTRSRTEDEGRAVTIHNRIDTLGDRIDRTYVRKDVHDAHVQRLDGEITNIKKSLSCPVLDRAAGDRE